ncbi:MAG TPA: hypothetical protein VMW72_04090 [Sedimentisphaerales bacterium]|nr:hypothetical protein [Sedimentisphaerales bacterium]
MKCPKCNSDKQVPGHDEFGSLMPLKDESVAGEPPVHDEFGHMGSTNRTGFSPSNREQEIKKLTTLFRDRNWAGDPAYFGKLLDNGWPADRIVGEDYLLAAHRWYGERLGSNVELRLQSFPGYSPGGIRYDQDENKWVLYMDLSKPQFEFRRFEKYEDLYLMHEHTHERQGRLMGLDTEGMLDKTYTVGEKENYRAALGFRDWESDFSMPPVFFTEQQQEILKAAGDEKEIVRQARDIHADTTALRMGHIHVKVNDREAALGLTPLTKTILEYVFEILNYTPESLKAAYADEFEVSYNIPLLARFRAVSNGLARRVDSLSQKDKDVLVKCLDIAGARIEGANMGGHTIADLEGGSIEERLESVGRLFDFQPSHYLTVDQGKAYEILTRAYTDHLLFCMDRQSALQEVGVDTLTAALNDDDKHMRARAADYMGETRDLRFLKPIQDRKRAEGNPTVKMMLRESAADIMQANLGDDEVWGVVDGMLWGGDRRELSEVARLIGAAPEDRLDRALSVLEQLSDKRYAPAYFKGAGDPAAEAKLPDIHSEVCRSLTRIGLRTPSKVVGLITNLAWEFGSETWIDNDLNVRHSEYNPRYGTPAVVQAIAREKPVESMRICEGLLVSGDAGSQLTAVAGMAQLFKTHKTEVLEMAKRCYVKIARRETSYPPDESDHISRDAHATNLIKFAAIVGRKDPDASLDLLEDFIRYGITFSGRYFFDYEFKQTLAGLSRKSPKRVSQLIARIGSWFYDTDNDPDLRFATAIDAANRLNEKALSAGEALEEITSNILDPPGKRDEHPKPLKKLIYLGDCPGRDAYDYYDISEPFTIIGKAATDDSTQLLEAGARHENPYIKCAVIPGIVALGARRPGDALRLLESLMGYFIQHPEQQYLEITRYYELGQAMHNIIEGIGILGPNNPDLAFRLLEEGVERSDLSGLDIHDYRLDMQKLMYRRNRDKTIAALAGLAEINPDKTLALVERIYRDMIEYNAAAKPVTHGSSTELVTYTDLSKEAGNTLAVLAKKRPDATFKLVKEFLASIWGLMGKYPKWGISTHSDGFSPVLTEIGQRNPGEVLDILNTTSDLVERRMKSATSLHPLHQQKTIVLTTIEGMGDRAPTESIKLLMEKVKSGMVDEESAGKTITKFASAQQLDQMIADPNTNQTIKEILRKHKRDNTT